MMAFDEFRNNYLASRLRIGGKENLEDARSMAYAYYLLSDDREQEGSAMDLVREVDGLIERGAE